MPTKSPLECLPSEITHKILSQLDELRSLHSAILTCHWLWAVYSKRNSEIVTQVILNQLDSWDVRPEALIAWKASKLPERVIAPSVREICKEHLNVREIDMHIPLTWNDASSISKLHSTVEKLADAFAKDSLQQLLCENGETSQSVGATASEKSRIMRTLYHFEMFCKMFRHPVVGSIRAQREQLFKCIPEFLSCFSPWENEQLTSVYEFLFMKVSPAFNEIAEHDVEWGSIDIHPALFFDGFDSRYVHTILMGGLDTITTISEADTYIRKHELIAPESRTPESSSHNLYASLKSFSLRPDTAAGIIGNYDNTSDGTSEIKPPFYQDPDAGPFEIWKWAQRSNSIRRDLRRRDQAKLRKCGYMMWDKKRLDSLGVFRHQWKPSKTEDKLERDVDSEIMRSICPSPRFHESHMKRSEIFEKGGRGWWDFGDESKIVWLYGKPAELTGYPEPWDPELELVPPISILKRSRADEIRAAREWSASFKLK